LSLLLLLLNINESNKHTSYCDDTNKILKNISFEKLLHTLALFWYYSSAYYPIPMEKS